MKKRIITVVICMAMVLTMFPIIAFAEESILNEETDVVTEEVLELQEDSTEAVEEVAEEEELVELAEEVVLETNESDFYYSVNNGEVTITGYKELETDVVIPSSIDGYPVTRIRNYAFYGCTGLTNITLPNGLMVLGDGAFYGCTGLTNITLPNGLMVLGDGAFYGCTNLTSITIPYSLTSFGTGDSDLGDGPFKGCTGLMAISVDPQNPFYDSRGDCNAIIETNTNKLIFGCKNTVIPDSVTSIGYEAFWYCTGLTSITLPDKLTSIGDYAFFDCTRLTSITLPDSITSIGNSAFSGCSGLTNIAVDPRNSVYDSREGCNAIIETNTNVLVYGCKNTVIPESVTSIGNNAFSGCTGLTSITFPNNVTSIGVRAFYSCHGLTSITLPDKLTSIDDCAFYNCTGLTSVTFPKGLTSIGKASFCDCTSLTSITFPDKLTSIDDRVFWGCTGLTSITFGNGLMSIGEQAFAECTGLTSIALPDSLTSIGRYAFSKCTGLTSITLPDKLTSIGDRVFSGCTGLTSITLPDSLTSIGSYAFEYCTGLASIILPDSLTSLPSHAFSKCTGLKSIAMPDSITSIGYNVFEKCKNFWIYCYSGTEAERYAKDYHIAYALITKQSSPISLPNTINMSTQATYQFRPTVNNSSENHNGMIWKSSNTDVATVDVNGRVNCVTRGKALITATSRLNKNIKATCEVTVLFKDATHENVTSGMFTAIYWVADKKITGEKVKFGTMNSMTRGQFVRFLYRYAGNPKVTSTTIKKYGSKFSDVDKNYTHFNAIVWAVSKGLIGGFPDGQFKPNDPLTRGNVATILWKYAGKPSVNNNVKPFVDVPQSTAIAWGKQKKIFGGYPDGTFKPNDNCLRGDFALSLYRYDKNK